jgi:hypothetical protein
MHLSLLMNSHNHYSNRHQQEDNQFYIYDLVSFSMKVFFFSFFSSYIPGSMVPNGGTKALQEFHDNWVCKAFWKYLHFLTQFWTS